VRAGGAALAAPPPAYSEFRCRLLAAHAALADESGFPRSVPIWRLRQSFRPDELPRELFDRYLVRLATEGALYFEKLTDYSRSTAEQRSSSLHHPVTGLLFYATVRAP
jgi:hypothetical protein